MSERTPEQIIGKDNIIQLAFEGYKVVRAKPAAWLSTGPNHHGLWWEMPDLPEEYLVEPLYSAPPVEAKSDLDQGNSNG